MAPASPARPTTSPIPRRLLVATVLAGILAAGGCMPGDDGPSPSPTATEDLSPSAEVASPEPTAEATGAQTQELTIPASALGVELTATVPLDWEDGVEGERYYVVSPTPFGDPAFSANLMVSSQTFSEGMSLDDIAVEVTNKLESEAGWSTNQPEGSSPTVGGRGAFQLSGRVEPEGAGQVAISVTAVPVETEAGTVVVFFQGMTSLDDTDAQGAIGAILDSVVIA